MERYADRFGSDVTVLVTQDQNSDGCVSRHFSTSQDHLWILLVYRLAWSGIILHGHDKELKERKSKKEKHSCVHMLERMTCACELYTGSNFVGAPAGRVIS